MEEYVVTSGRFSAGPLLFMQLFDQLPQLIREAVHGALEAGQEVERDDDGEAYAGDGREQVLFHVSHLPLSFGQAQTSSSTSTLRKDASLKATGRAPSSSMAFLAMTFWAQASTVSLARSSLGSVRERVFVLALSRTKVICKVRFMACSSFHYIEAAKAFGSEARCWRLSRGGRDWKGQSAESVAVSVRWMSPTSCVCMAARP